MRGGRACLSAYILCGAGPSLSQEGKETYVLFGQDMLGATHGWYWKFLPLFSVTVQQVTTASSIRKTDRK